MARMFTRGDEGEKPTLRAARQIGEPAAGLIDIAIADTSALVRIEAVEAALAAKIRPASTLRWRWRTRPCRPPGGARAAGDAEG